MRRFIARALDKLPKLDKVQIRSLIYDMATENELFDVVFDSLSDGVIVLSESHAVLLYNKSAERLLSLPPSDVYERPIWESISDDEIAEFIRVSLVNQERVYDKEYSLEGKGPLRIISCSIMPLVRSGMVQGNLLHIEDVTEKRSEEARLRRAESLAALTTLAAGVAHEIKNPLGSLGIHLQLVQRSLKKTGPVDTGEISKYLDVINEEVDRLNRIVIDFLFAVRPMDAKLVSSNLNRIVADVLDFVQFELEDAGISVVSKLDETIPNLDLDEKFIKQALLNLVKNAASAMTHGGTLTVSTRRDGEAVLLAVIDNGVGVSEENMAKIFEPYFTTKEFGSGLGLTVVYKIVKEHRGEISVESKEGKGTRFTISFPVPQRELKMIGWKDGNG